MTSYTSVEDLLVDSVIMIALDKEEREKTHLIHEAIAKEKGVIIDEVDLSDVVRMIYITGMAEYGVETKRERAQRLRWEEVRKKMMDEYARMDMNTVEFNTDRFVEALMKEGEE